MAADEGSACKSAMTTVGAPAAEQAEALVISGDVGGTRES